jgi:hypothetical protein
MFFSAHSALSLSPFSGDAVRRLKPTFLATPCLAENCPDLFYLSSSVVKKTSKTLFRSEMQTSRQEEQ